MSEKVQTKSEQKTEGSCYLKTFPIFNNLAGGVVFGVGSVVLGI